ncbi:hypothetical protein B296_00057039 [Ensete ventricosum]|uniref:Uncharacterized protein n=1 Tax=Ensete ventricosum TaxID=4639 RepID=A0A426XSV7_ENSVE|nr:hypothetical protein B296_00057039 [Ensete ventricosum]
MYHIPLRTITWRRRQGPRLKCARCVLKNGRRVRLRTVPRLVNEGDRVRLAPGRVGGYTKNAYSNAVFGYPYRLVADAPRRVTADEEKGRGNLLQPVDQPPVTSTCLIIGGVCTYNQGMSLKLGSHTRGCESVPLGRNR